MKKFLLLLLVCPLFIACSDDDNDDEGYLTSIESVKSGLLGIWRNIGGGYETYNTDGSLYFGTSIDSWYANTTYEVVKSGSDYMIRIYAMGETSGQYTDWRILVLDDKKMTTKAIGGHEEEINSTRVSLSPAGIVIP